MGLRDDTTNGFQRHTLSRNPLAHLIRFWLSVTPSGRRPFTKTNTTDPNNPLHMERFKKKSDSTELNRNRALSPCQQGKPLDPGLTALAPMRSMVVAV